MRINLTGITIVCFNLLFTTACLFGEKKADHVPRSAKDVSWPEYMSKHLNESEFKAAYGLFTYSGWSDVGQVMVFDGNPNEPMQVIWVKSNSKAVSGTYTLSDDKTKSLRTMFKHAHKLKNVEPPVFDGVQFTFQHLVKNDDEVKLQHKIFMNNPDQAEPKPKEHLALVNEMLALKKEKNSK